MEIAISQANGRFPIKIFHLTGDFLDEETLVAQAASAVASGDRYILLDLKKVRSIGSAGLRGLHRVFQLLQEAGNADHEAVKKGILAGTYTTPYLKLLSPSKNAVQALHLAGYDMYLDIYTNQKTAVNSF
jgi:ABC-type transporter Mla MlaB component